MKKIFALLICAAMIRPQEALLPLARAADAADSPSADDRVSLEGVEVAPDQVILHLDGQVHYKAFVTSNPPRLVLELLNTEVDLSSKNVEGKGQYLKRIRSGQFAGEPNPIARVVMELSQSVDYRVVQSGNDLQVSLASSRIEAEAKPAAPPPEKPAALEKISASSKPAAGSSVAVPAAPAVALEEQIPAPMSTKHSPAMGAIASRGAAVRPAIQDAPAAVRAAASAARTTGRISRRDILSTLPRDLISLDLDNTDVGDILKLMAAKANLNIIYGTDISGPLSLHLADVPFNEAFNIVMSMGGLVATQVGNNILRVETPSAMTVERTGAIGITRIFSINYKKAADVKTEIDAILGAQKRTGKTVIDEMNNQLIVTESPDGIIEVERLLDQIDVRPQQVLIETKLIEVSLNKDLELGIQWDYLGSFPSGQVGGQRAVNQVGNIVNPNPALGFTSPASNGAGQPLATAGFSGQTLNSPGASGTGRGTGVFLPADKQFGAFTFGRITNNYFLTATLTAAASEGKAKVLSDPKIATLNGKKATINITTQIPYVTSNATANTVTSQVSFQQTGIQLTVTPTITADGRINMLVNPVVSKPSAIAAQAGQTGAVAVDNRQAETTVLVRDGETIVIGGMITDAVSDTISKVPLLGDIPILGWLFKKKTLRRNRVELLIFVTPRIMPD